MSIDLHQAIAAAAEESYGKLLALLSKRTGSDFALAEDALGEAFVAAMKTWEKLGIPKSPEAWLLTAAKRKIIDIQRRGYTRSKSLEALKISVEEALEKSQKSKSIPDERLSLLFVCAHPSIDPASRAPLMLQTVLGMKVAKIASAFLTSPAAMEQRLVRAKRKIRDAAIPFRIPSENEWTDRINDVLSAIYASATVGKESGAGQLIKEAEMLLRISLSQLPNEPELKGLLALLLFIRARDGCDRNQMGVFIPIDQQDVAGWNNRLILEAEKLLHEASQASDIGRFQIEAAIQSVHMDRRKAKSTNWDAISKLYETLLILSPTVGVKVNRAIAILKCGDPKSAYKVLVEIPDSRIQNYQPYWVAMAEISRDLHNDALCYQAANRAIGLSKDSAIRAYISEAYLIK